MFAGKVLDGNQSSRDKKLEELVADVNESMAKGEALDIGKAAFKATMNLLSTTLFSVDLADPTSDNVRELKDAVWGYFGRAWETKLSRLFPTP